MITRLLAIVLVSFALSLVQGSRSAPAHDANAQESPDIYDLNGDGAITLADVQTVVFHIGGGDPASDVNADGSVTLADALAVLAQVGERVALPPLPAPWVGVNNWGLANSTDVFDGCGSATEAALDEKLSILKAAGVDVIRFAAYQSFATDDARQRKWTALDRVFARALAHGMHLIPILGNDWIDCDYLGPEPTTYSCSTPPSRSCGAPVACGGTGNWYDIGYTLPYDGYPTSFQRWTTEVVTRYGGHPALAAWEVLNEPFERCAHSFFLDITARIRGADPLTPISLGGDAQGWDYLAENSIPAIGWMTSHDYYRPKQPLPADIAADMLDARTLGKSYYIGESGVDCEHDGGPLDPDEDPNLCTPCDGPLRAEYLRAKMRMAFQYGAAGYIVWAYGHHTPLGSCSYDFGPDSPVLGIFREF